MVRMAGHMTRGSHDSNLSRMEGISWSRMMAGDLLWMWMASLISDLVGVPLVLSHQDRCVIHGVVMTGGRAVYRDGRSGMFSIHICL